MSTHPLRVDDPYSFAHRTGAGLRIVLDLVPSGDVLGDTPVLRLRNKGRFQRATASLSQHGDRLRLEATLPRSRLAPGVWMMAVRPSDGGAPFRRVQARLLVSRDRPLALLLGPAPRTRSTSTSTGSQAWSAPRRLVEATLRRLPERPARRARAAARAAGRRLKR